MSATTTTRPVPAADARTLPPGAREVKPPTPTPSARGGSAKPRNSRGVALLAAAGLLAALGAGWVYVPSLYSVATDDAYVQADTVSVVPKVSAYVAALHIGDNTPFQKGDLLIELDPRDYRIALDIALADLHGAEAGKADIQAQLEEQGQVVAAGQAAVDGDKATLTFAAKQLSRYRDLAGTGFGTGQRLEQAQSDNGVQVAALQRDQANLQAARARVDVLQSQMQQADATIARQRAAVDGAKLNLSYTNIYADAAGSVANRTVQVGNFVQPGQMLFSAVPSEVFVVANCKETQLDRLRIGQAVLIGVDAFPGQQLHAPVDSFQRGTGSTFALLPPEHATGNFVKVVQRVPVKIVFDEPVEVTRSISPGMSVEVDVSVAAMPNWLPGWLRGRQK